MNKWDYARRMVQCNNMPNYKKGDKLECGNIIIKCMLLNFD
jgi:hypothetical protein